MCLIWINDHIGYRGCNSAVLQPNALYIDRERLQHLKQVVVKNEDVYASPGFSLVEYKLGVQLGVEVPAKSWAPLCQGRGKV